MVKKQKNQARAVKNSSGDEKRAWWKPLLFPAFILVLCLGSFGLGKLSALHRASPPVRVVHAENRVFPEGVNWQTKNEATAYTHLGEKKYVASKNGSRYYLPNCSGVRRIKEENKVWFGSKEEAEYNGLTPAKNCPGI